MSKLTEEERELLEESVIAISYPDLIKLIASCGTAVYFLDRGMSVSAAREMASLSEKLNAMLEDMMLNLAREV